MAALGLTGTPIGVAGRARTIHRLWCGGESKDNSTDFGVAVKNKDNYTDFGVAEKARTIPSTLVWR